MNYLELKEKHQKEVNEFPFGFAFSKEQFEKMMQEFGLTKNDTDKIYSIGAGGYIKKSDAPAMDEMFKRHNQELKDAIINDKDGSGFIYQMFDYELANHEYCITHDLEETLESLSLTEKDIEENENLQKGLKKALKRYRR